jgi:hypothetical protein
MHEYSGWFVLSAVNPTTTKTRSTILIDPSHERLRLHLEAGHRTPSSQEGNVASNYHMMVGRALKDIEKDLL